MRDQCTTSLWSLAFYLIPSFSLYGNCPGKMHIEIAFVGGWSKFMHNACVHAIAEAFVSANRRQCFFAAWTNLDIICFKRNCMQVRNVARSGHGGKNFVRLDRESVFKHGWVNVFELDSPHRNYCHDMTKQIYENQNSCAANRCHCSIQNQMWTFLRWNLVRVQNV